MPEEVWWCLVSVSGFIERLREGLVFQGANPVCSGLFGPKPSDELDASCVEPSYPPLQSSVSSSVGHMKGLLPSPQSTWPTAASGHSAPCLSDLSSRRMFSALLIMIVSTGGDSQASNQDISVSFYLEYGPKKSLHYWRKGDTSELFM